MTKEEKEQKLMELKSHAYDAIAQKELWMNTLQSINKEIQHLTATPTEEEEKKEK